MTPEPATPAKAAPANSPARVLFASMIGTTIEFFDFYIYATAAVLVFPQLFFPAGDANAAMLQSLATFALAFFARPVGSAVFGHFGDRIGRQATLVAALLTMGLSTVAIGLLPTHAQVGVLAPALLALCRFGQGLGLGGEWGGAVLLATENAPAGKRAWYGMFPQLGAPVGFILATGAFIALDRWLDDASFFAWGWRVPFLGSAVLVALGLWMRLRLEETPAFRRVLERDELQRLPVLSVFAEHPRALVAGVFASLATFVLFYLMTVFALGWATLELGYARDAFLWLQLLGVAFFALTIPLAGLAADRRGRRFAMVAVTVAIALFGLSFDVLFVAGDGPRMSVFLVLGMCLMGFTYGPLGAYLAEQFPAPVRYSGTSLAFNLSGILGASLAPYAAMWLAAHFGIASVGWYLTVAAVLTLAALLAAPRARDD